MNSLDLIGTAFKNLWRRKVRSILTILGVVIGTASIVVMLSLGIGMNESFKNQVSMMGSLNVIQVDTYYYPDTEDGEVDYSRPPQRNTLDDKTMEIMAQIKGVEAVTPLLHSYLKFVSGKYVAHMQLVGINTATMGAFDFKLSAGRLLTGEDTISLVFGSYIPHNFYDPSSRYWYYGNNEEPNVDVLNDKIVMTFDMSYGERYPGMQQKQRDRRNRPIDIEVVGLLEEGQSDKDYSAYINIDYLKKLIQANSRNSKTPGRISYGITGGSDTQGYENAWVKVKKLEDVEEVQKTIKGMGFGAWSYTDILRQMLQATETLRTVLGAIGAVAFFIAAIGITNTMVMSIYERTREIGIMKVLGCVLADIRKLFLLESAMIGLLGGILGIGFSYGASYLLNHSGISFIDIGWSPPGAEATISIIPLWLTGTAVTFASFIGIISGAYPAVRAMKLSALDAIRNE